MIVSRDTLFDAVMAEVRAGADPLTALGRVGDRYAMTAEAVADALKPTTEDSEVAA